MRDFMPKNPLGFFVAIALYVIALNYLPSEPLIQVFTEPKSIFVASLAAGIAWTLRNEI